MKISLESNLLKSLFKNVYFINGTAYAGKSTAVKNLAERFGGVCCGENYHSELSHLTDREHQPNLSYFQTMSGWEEFLNRTPEQYAAWIDGTAREAAELELLMLIRIAQEGKPVFVDTNIHPDTLKEISDYDHVAIMLSPQSTSVDRFFDRSDPEKQFLFEQIQLCPDPELTMSRFRASIARINSPEQYRKFEESGFFTLVRDDSRTQEETCDLLARHFRLTDEKQTAGMQGEPDGIRLVPYTAAHSDTLISFIRAFFNAHHCDISVEQSEKNLSEWTQDNHRLFVIERKGEPVGFLRLHNSSPTVSWIDDIYVDSPHRGQGIAGKAIRLAEDLLRAEGSRSFCMEVVPDNIPAIRLYHRLGYDRLSLITMRKDDEAFQTARCESIAGIPLRVKQF